VIDLHMHSIFSDGSMTPEELIAEGLSIGLKGMALTDHDTVGGVPRFIEAAEKVRMPVMTGVEVSADLDHGTLHMLGYGVDHKDRSLIEHLRWIRQGRDERNQEILHKINQLGIRLTMDEVTKYAGADVVGRPHFAQAMIAKGIVKDKREAFDRFLAKGKPAYAERRRLEPAATIELIRGARGLPVVAHPFTLKRNTRELRDFIAQLKAAGLGGIEVYYSEHTHEMQREFAALAKDLDLVATGGSDYHGTMSPGVHMGRGSSGLKVPDHVWDAIQTALRG